MYWYIVTECLFFCCWPTYNVWCCWRSYLLMYYSTLRWHASDFLARWWRSFPEVGLVIYFISDV